MQHPETELRLRTAPESQGTRTFYIKAQSLARGLFVGPSFNVGQRAPPTAIPSKIAHSTDERTHLTLCWLLLFRALRSNRLLSH